MNFIAVIPARFNSKRFPGKPLVCIKGKPIIIHMINRIKKSGAYRIIVATDHPDIASAVIAAKGEVCLTHSQHQSGTERLVEVIDKYQFADETIVVNVQGDEPMIPPDIVRQVACNLVQQKNSCMATIAVPITNIEDVFNPDVVKVVTDAYGYAIYFSRAAIPWDREAYAEKCKQIGKLLLRHIGIYAYRAKFIRRYATWKPCPLENIELLEQLRVLWYREKIHVDIVKTNINISINTPEDIKSLLLAMD
ncbi:3-deoxy-manno-octulosonate cytidylyltransferase [Pantoea sp. Aalb]|uniref:3-deoxy-manno-octulosonate cytidylyltransferase n=1 Tax=Pantoea sp. Aalb TaxID=2576762 RepID=UPI00132AE942|nr:3-deoxy-manno-octulosonate cytidylyltransferase [Pantoea sp. Aalb]MXP67489.1 3-deoxy-manno-octulosonate cytidylyltransferase [Pantoea sp. Aalb]